MPEESLGWPAQTDQTQACGWTLTLPQLFQERTTLNPFSLLCGVCNATALELSKSCWHLWECSVFLADHPLCFSITRAHHCAARYHCRSRLTVYLRSVCYSWSFTLDLQPKGVPQACLPKLGIWPFQPWSQRQLDFR